MLDLTTATSHAVKRYNGGLLISWSGSLPAGQVWQVYANQRLAGHTSRNRFHVPAPSGTAQFAVGSVPLADAGTSFATDLPPQPKTRVTLSWQGGMFQDPVDGDVAGFRVYGEQTPGSGIDYGTPLADIPANIGRVRTDGFGIGGFGQGGFGYAAGNYSWTSGNLASGTWTWAVVAYDTAGNEGAPATYSETILAPPTEPPPFSDGTRLHYTLIGFGQVPWNTGGWGEPLIQLNWLASTG